jgi:heme-degrading monooxygenase HmoA
MYGTVAVMRLKPGAEAKLKELLETFNDLEIPGFLFEYLYRLDADPNAYVMVAAFESKERQQPGATRPLPPVSRPAGGRPAVARRRDRLPVAVSTSPTWPRGLCPARGGRCRGPLHRRRG